MLNTYIYSNT